MTNTLNPSRKFSGLGFAALFAVLAAMPPARAQSANEPVLRLDTGMHTAPIRRIATDAQGRWLVTASHDKTVRLWDLASGRLLQVLRPPIGEENEGRLDAVAMSPDGELVATGGWTVSGATSGHSIYIFRRNGTLLRALPGQENVITHLAWSPNGLYLVATLWAGGIRVYRTADFSLIAIDREYGKSSYGADFDLHGHLVTSCDDGYLRLYRVSDRTFTLLVKNNAPGGTRPHLVKFSPDGRLVAVGFANSTKVNVLRADTLDFAYAPDTHDVKGDNLASVAWSADGSQLYATGRWNVKGKYPVRVWKEAGRDGYMDIIHADSVISHFVALPDGGIAFGSGNPAWGRFTATGEQIRFVASQTADFRGAGHAFRVSRDGVRVTFGYESWGKQPGGFDLTQGVLTLGTAGPGMEAARTSVEGLSITDWDANTAPRLAGKRLPLEPYEESRSLAIAPDAARSMFGGERDAVSFVLGTDWYLRRFDSDGRLMWDWKRELPGIAWQVNWTGDGRYVLAALADGTIRWYRARDGVELLAFFPHGDRKRWIVWSPSGYYDAAPGAEELIGWHINRGPDKAADFFPVSRFRNQYYRPDVISRVIETGDEAQAVRLANQDASGQRAAATVAQVLPPVVEILSPQDSEEVGASPAHIRFHVRAPADAPATALRVQVNGRPVTIADVKAALGRAAVGVEIAVPVPSSDSVVSVFAQNRHNWSAEAKVRLKWRGPVSAQSQLVDKLYVLAIGISKYRDPNLELEFAAKDAEDFVKAIEGQKGLYYRDVIPHRIPEQDATRIKITERFAWLHRSVTDKDMVMLFFSGHGKQDANGRFYFLSVEAEEKNLMGTAISKDDITHALGSLKGKVVFFMDSCRAGRVAEGKGRKGTDVSAVINELSSAENGIAVYTSSTRWEFSLEHPRWQNGAFTKALIEGISGKAADLNGDIWHQMLGVYISNRVRELTEERQHPVPGGGVPDFRIAVIR